MMSFGRLLLMVVFQIHFVAGLLFYVSDVALLFSLPKTEAFEFSSPSRSWSSATKNRREFVEQILTATGTISAATAGAATSSLITNTNDYQALALTLPQGQQTVGGGGLASRLDSRNPDLLKNSIFNVPPAAQVYPQFMRGTWDVTCKFGGYLFPSTKISKQQLVSKPDVPGFQKCSIVPFSDIGSGGKDVHYSMKIDEQSGLEDRQYTLTNEINDFLGYAAVSEVIYDVKSNPNRISIDFVDYKTKNAERIELFCNARESEQVMKGDEEIFVCSEYIRQVTFSGGTEVGIPRQVVGNYAHFWTWRQKQQVDENNAKIELVGNVLTAAYLDPQDPLFFNEPSKPIAVYSHILRATKRNS